MDVHGRLAVVTGASMGIGEAIDILVNKVGAGTFEPLDAMTRSEVAAVPALATMKGLGLFRPARAESPR